MTQVTRVITRPTPFDDLTSSAAVIRNKLAFTVEVNSDYVLGGLLAPGMYGLLDIRQFVKELRELGSPEAIERWLDDNPLPR